MTPHATTGAVRQLEGLLNERCTAAVARVDVLRWWTLKVRIKRVLAAVGGVDIEPTAAVILARLQVAR